MSVPSSIQAGPFTTTILVKKKYALLYAFLMWVSMASILLEFWVFWQEMYNWQFIFAWRDIHFYLLLPLVLFIMYLTAVLVSLVFAKLLLGFVNLIHKPREGVFLRDPSDKDYRYWNIRNIIKRWPIWLSHKFPFPFLDNLCFKMFGVKTKFSNSLFEGWVDCEFIEFGNNVVVGQGAIIQSAVIVGNLLIIRKTTIKDNSRIGTHAIIMPGTEVQDNCVLAAASATTVGQVLEKDWIYVGIPAKKFKKNRFFEKNLESVIKEHVGDYDTLREKYDNLYLRRHDEQAEHISLKERIQHQKEKIEDRRKAKKERLKQKE
ncbi:MAG: hypothetical protein JW891_09220 [Candidatus Lokiarchaeota archaeon]|nr:hypothetical protein [Candidatus Lokiarchaeota archaeon]